MNQSSREHGWDKTRGQLANAHEILATIRISSEARVDVQRYLDNLERNELEQAIESLAAAGEKEAVPREFWIALRNAAVNMGLDHHAAEFLKRAEQA